MSLFTTVGSESPQEKAERFLAARAHFQLGSLMTEASHPKTRNLAEWSRHDLVRGLEALHQVDLDALQALIEKASALGDLKKDITETLSSGGRVFLCGCGATGRLSLTLEFLWRSLHNKSDQVRAFMAGGDVALIRSIESFEDHFEFGARQLKDLEFSSNDLLIGVTEGGETSFVIGAVREASQRSSRQPYFLYCNPEETLRSLVDRSREVLESEKIRSISLSVGPMALSGSTRMQASTVLLLAVGACLFSQDSPVEVITQFRDLVKQVPFDFLEPFTESEARTYQQEQRVIYQTDEFGMTILTDTTERSPTFSLSPFENFDDSSEDHSLCYFSLLGTESAEQAWQRLLLRSPRALTWSEYANVAGPQRLLGYDFSIHCAEKRQNSTTKKESHEFEIVRGPDGGILWRFQENTHRLQLPDLSQETRLLFEHLLLKVLLNAHSTLLMGRLDRYEGNWMTWVKPNNGKLIDRAARYVLSLAEHRQLQVSYEDVILAIFQEIPDLSADEPVVIKVLQRLEVERSAQ